MTHFVRDDVGLREIAGRVETLAQRFVERQIDIDLFVTGTVERAHSRAGHSARRLHLVRKEHERWFTILTTVLSKDLVPNVFRFAQHYGDELFKFFFFKTPRT